MNTAKKGSYILILKNEKSGEWEVGKLGRVSFEKGYYVYVGSAMGGVNGRVKRHFRKDKKRYWHIDYLAPDRMQIIKVYIISRANRIEEQIAERIERIASHLVKGFGSSDTRMRSHLFFFPTPPQENKPFMDLLLDLEPFSDIDTDDFH